MDCKNALMFGIRQSDDVPPCFNRLITGSHKVINKDESGRWVVGESL
jgi:hypothetical protein